VNDILHYLTAGTILSEVNHVKISDLYEGLNGVMAVLKIQKFDLRTFRY
jgi:hypothetical protein